MPIRLRECDWDELPLAKIQGRPNEWLGSLDKLARDKAWTEISKSLKPVIAQAQQRRKVTLSKQLF